jgi:hypothetical protein
MNTFWRIAPLLTRLPLVLAVIFFLFLAGQWLVDPMQVAVLTESRITLPSPAAVTNMRGTGALFVPLAGILLACLFSERRVLLGLRLLTAIVGGAFVVRWVIVAFDGMTPLLARILRFESLILMISVAGLILETMRRTRKEKPHEMSRERDSAVPIPDVR